MFRLGSRLTNGCEVVSFTRRLPFTPLEHPGTNLYIFTSFDGRLLFCFIRRTAAKLINSSHRLRLALPNGKMSTKQIQPVVCPFRLFTGLFYRMHDLRRRAESFVNSKGLFSNIDMRRLLGCDTFWVHYKTAFSKESSLALFLLP
jgi:hypothetical protein